MSEPKVARPISTAAPAPDQKKTVQPIAADKVKYRDFTNNPERVAFIAPGIAPEDIEATGSCPHFWESVAGGYQFGDRTQGRAEDRTWIGDYVCIDAGPGYALMKLERVTRTGGIRGEVKRKQNDELYTIERTPDGEKPGWVLRRKKTDTLSEIVILDPGGYPFATEEAARRHREDVLLREQKPVQYYTV